MGSHPPLIDLPFQKVPPFFTKPQDPKPAEVAKPFTQFQTLVSEIRLKIWCEAIVELRPERQILPVKVKRATTDTVAFLSTPELVIGTRAFRKFAQTCSEARSEARKLFPDTLPIEKSGKVWFSNDGGDILLLMGTED